jgi:protease I
MVIAQVNFRDEELFEPLEVFESLGYKIDIAAPKLEEAKGMLGATVKPTITIKTAKVYEYDAVVFVGGRGAAGLMDSPEVIQLVKDAFNRQKIVGAICIAPMILAKAGVLKGKKATVAPSNEAHRLFKQAEVNLVNEEVVASGHVVTADGPHASKKFARKIAELII